MSVENPLPTTAPDLYAEISQLRRRIQELEQERDGAAWGGRRQPVEERLQVCDPVGRPPWSESPFSRAKETVGQELLQRIIDAIPVMITIYDPALQSFRFNQEFRHVLGWTEQDMRRGDPMELFYPDPREREKVRHFMQSLAGGWQDLRVTAKNGEAVDSSWANIRLADQTQVGIGIDLRHRKGLEEELRRAKDCRGRQPGQKRVSGQYES